MLPLVSRTLQPHVAEAATVRSGGCGPVPEAAALYLRLRPRVCRCSDPRMLFLVPNIFYNGLSLAYTWCVRSTPTLDPGSGPFPLALALVLALALPSGPGPGPSLWLWPSPSTSPHPHHNTCPSSNPTRYMYNTFVFGTSLGTSFVGFGGVLGCLANTLRPHVFWLRPHVCWLQP